MAQIERHILGYPVYGLSTTISHILEGLMSHSFDVVGDFILSIGKLQKLLFKFRWVL